MMLEVSGSYILSALIIAAALRFWQTNSEAKKALYAQIDLLKKDLSGQDKRVAVLESERAATQQTLKEIKEDVRCMKKKQLIFS